MKWSISECESKTYFCVNFMNEENNKRTVVHISFDYEYIAVSESFREKSILEIAIEELEKIPFFDRQEFQKIYITFVFE